MNDEKIKIMIIETDEGCYISDCYACEGEYDYTYHKSLIPNLLFDGMHAVKTWSHVWYKIKNYPKKVKIFVKGKTYNQRYEIKNKENITEKMPAVIKYYDEQKYDEDVINVLYEYKHDVEDDSYEKCDVEFELICKVNGKLHFVDFEYNAKGHKDFNDASYTVTHENIEHPMFGKILYPEIMLSETGCSLSSKTLYEITRQYVSDHIDLNVAKIVHDEYTHFEVCKIARSSHNDLFSMKNVFCNNNTYKIHDEKLITVFKMTSYKFDRDNDYALDPIYAHNEQELKEKLDKWLTELMNFINTPVEMCPLCHGEGYDEKSIKSYNKKEND
jgi:hypothetical protein